MQSSRCMLHEGFKRVGKLQDPGEVLLRNLTVVAALSGTGVEPLNASKIGAKTEVEAKTGTEEGFEDAAWYILLQV